MPRLGNSQGYDLKNRSVQHFPWFPSISRPAPLLRDGDTVGRVITLVQISHHLESHKISYICSVCVSCLRSSFSNGPTFTRHYMIHGVAGHLFQRERSHRLGLISFLNTPQASSFVPLHAQLLTSAPRCSLILFNSSSFHLFLVLLNLHRFLFLLCLVWNHHHPFLKIEMVPFLLFPHPIFFKRKFLHDQFPSLTLL